MSLLDVNRVTKMILKLFILIGWFLINFLQLNIPERMHEYIERCENCSAINIPYNYYSITRVADEVYTTDFFYQCVLCSNEYSVLNDHVNILHE